MERSLIWEKNTARSMNKQELRKELKKRRNALPQDVREAYSRQICQNLLDLPMVKEADLIYAYSATRSEVSLQMLIEDAWERHSRIGMPKVFGDEMKFFAIRQLSDLSEGAFGILEPQARAENLLTGNQGICLVPGLGFDAAGGRIGYGKGYYDRYLQAFPGLIRIGCCFDEQLVEKIPKEVQDVSMDYLMTTSGLLVCKGNEERA